MSSLRWGILGPGGIARSFASDLRLHGFDLRAVGSRSLERADSFANDFGVPRAHGSCEDLVADDEVDIVYVATPHPQHVEPALAAIAHGKHVLVEKAFTANAIQAHAIREAAERAGVLALEAMWTRYLPHMTRIRELVRSGALGDVRAVVADHTQKLPDDPAHRLNNLELGGGALLDLGIYPISFAWDVLGAPTNVQATARLKATGADAETAVQYSYASGAIASLFASSTTAGRNIATVLGTEARIEIDRVWYTPTSFRVVLPNGEIAETFESDVSGRGMHFQALAAERLIADGNMTGDVLPISETVAIMESLDEIRQHIGVIYPSDEPKEATATYA